MWNQVLWHDSKQISFFLMLIWFETMFLILCLRLWRDLERYVMKWIHFKDHKGLWLIQCWHFQSPTQLSKCQRSSWIFNGNFWPNLDHCIQWNFKHFPLCQSKHEEKPHIFSMLTQAGNECSLAVINSHHRLFLSSYCVPDTTRKITTSTMDLWEGFLFSSCL